MRKLRTCKLSVFILILAFLFCPGGRVSALTDQSSYAGRNMMVSRTDLKKYFEKAMSLFESAKYEEAVTVFEDLIRVEKIQNENYFTPFAEIYIEKSKARIQERLVSEDRKWAKMKMDLVKEAERVAKESAQKAEKLMESEQDRILREETEKRKEFLKQKETEKQEERKAALRMEQEARDLYDKGLEYYNHGNYPMAIAEFNKIMKLYPDSRLLPRAGSYMSRAQDNIKKEEEEGLLARMEAAKRASIEVELEKKRLKMEEERRAAERRRKEIEKVRLRKIFEARLKDKMRREEIARIEGLMDAIRKDVTLGNFEEAEKLLDEAIASFPENKKFKDISHYVQMQKIKVQEDALKKARDIIEEKMLLEVAEKHMIPEEKTGSLEKEKKITPLVKVPEIRKRLRIPISVDFKDIELDYVLSFLSDATGVNIVSSTEINMEDKKVSIKLKDMPLEDALKYILKSQGLVYRIEEDAVWVTTKEEMDNENVETRVYFLNQGVGRFAEFTDSSSGEDASSSSSEVKTVKDVLENAVDWPKDSKLTMDDRTGALIVSNIPSNLETIENLLYSLDVTPTQVLIEAKFLEVKVTDVDELGIEWKLNSDWGFTQNNAKQNVHGFASSSGVDFSDFTNQDQGFNLTYQGILSHPQFQAVMRALQQKQNVKTLSAPRITTLNNQTATIEVIDEYIYPTRYEVSLVQFDINGDGDFDDAGETEWANIPQDFVTRDVGILLHVKPSVGADNKTITLALTPEVSEDSGTFSYSGDVSIPQFKTRNLSTSVIVGDGETVVLGGLIKETNTDTENKVPFLGDLPLVGRLFKKNTESTERRNLLIFVTAKVLNKEGNAVASAPDAEK